MDLGQDAALGVLRHNSFGLPMVEVQAVADDRFVVVRAPRFFRPAKQAVNELFVVGRQLQYDVELLVAFSEDLVQVVHLGNSPG